MNDIRIRKKANSNYALEVNRGPSAEGENLWAEIKQGFVSPEQALDYARKEKIRGIFRVVRIASEEFSGNLVTPEPVFEIIRAKTGRKVNFVKKSVKTVKKVEQTELDVQDSFSEGGQDEENFEVPNS